jgi:hypothetical protein
MTAAVCGVATLAAATFDTAEAARPADVTTQDPLRVQPLAVSPNKPPLDAGRDGGGASLPPLPDAKVPLSDAADTPL